MLPEGSAGSERGVSALAVNPACMALLSDPTLCFAEGRTQQSPDPGQRGTGTGGGKPLFGLWLG